MDDGILRRKTPPPAGAVWSIENALAIIVVVGFSIASWGIFKDLSWWEPVAVVSAIIGLVAVVPFALGISQIGVFADLGVEINLGMHILGCAGVLALTLLPTAHHWLARL